MTLHKVVTQKMVARKALTAALLLRLIAALAVRILRYRLLGVRPPRRRRDSRLCGRTPGQSYPSRDERLLRAMAPQLAAVVHALELTTQVQKQCDAVQGATGRERERLRRDLHDGLGPSLTVGGLGLQTLGDAVGPARPRELVDAVQREATADVAEVRRILDDLAPAALADGTSAGALEQRIAAVAGQLMFLYGLGAALAASTEVAVVGEARDGEALARVVAAERPAVVLTDLEMPGVDGSAPLREFATPSPTLAC